MGATCLHRYTCCIHEYLNAAMHWAVMLIEYADALQRGLRFPLWCPHSQCSLQMKVTFKLSLRGLSDLTDRGEVR